MKKLITAARYTSLATVFFFLLSVIVVGGGTSSCSRKTGCPANENVHVKPNRKGELPTKGGSSSLFPKKMQKKM